MPYFGGLHQERGSSIQCYGYQEERPLGTMRNQSSRQAQHNDRIFHISRLHKKFRSNKEVDSLHWRLCLLSKANVFWSIFSKRFYKISYSWLKSLKDSLKIFSFFETTAIWGYPTNQTHFIKRNLNKPLNVLKALTPDRWDAITKKQALKIYHHYKKLGHC